MSFRDILFEVWKKPKKQNKKFQSQSFFFGWIPWTTAKLVQLSSIGEDDKSNLGIAKNGKLIGFLQKSVPSLCKSHLPVDLVLDPLQLYPPSSHFSLFLSFSVTKQILILLSKKGKKIIISNILLSSFCHFFFC